MTDAYQVTRYHAGAKADWDRFVAESRNGTFLLQRDYMDYHAERFADHSLLIMEGAKIIALLPANRADTVVHSHQGLTYGGFVIGVPVTAATMIDMFDSVLSHLRAERVNSLIYKTIPHIYHHAPSEEDLYALFRLDAVLHSRTVLSVIDQRNRLPLQERRRRGVKRAKAANIVVSRSEDWEGYWRLLEEQLAATHGVRPVHSLAEILLLKERFPQNISLFTARAGDRLMGGSVIYVSRNVAHAQYIVASPEGRDSGALDILFSTLMDEEFFGIRFFDYGISNEQGGRYLNVGLVEQKCGFGARAVVHDIYRLDL